MSLKRIITRHGEVFNKIHLLEITNDSFRFLSHNEEHLIKMDSIEKTVWEKTHES